MKARTIQRFRDIAAGKVRERGDVFELTEERFAEINAKLPNFIEEVEEKKTKKASSKEEEKD